MAGRIGAPRHAILCPRQAVPLEAAAARQCERSPFWVRVDWALDVANHSQKHCSKMAGLSLAKFIGRKNLAPATEQDLKPRDRIRDFR